MKLICFLSLVCLGLPAFSQVLPAGFSYGRITGYSSMRADAFSFMGNTAALAGLKKISSGIYGERRFLLQQIGFYKFAVGLPSTYGHFGLTGYYEGGSLYNQNQVGLAYARRMDKIDLGLQFNYYSQQVVSYSKNSTMNFSLGALLHITDDLQAGFQVDNPVRSEKISGEGSLPSLYTAGIGWDASDKVFFAVLADKGEDEPVNFLVGIRYSFDRKLRCGLGFFTATNSFYCGAGVNTKGLALDLTASLHPYLGITPGIMLTYTNEGK